MKLTKHAEKRLRQRGFSKLSLNIIRECGRTEGAPGGAIKLFFGKKEYQEAVAEFKRAIQLLDKAKGGTIIMDNEDVLTVYHKEKSPSQAAQESQRMVMHE
jgi:hypothetical protein